MADIVGVTNINAGNLTTQFIIIAYAIILFTLVGFIAYWIIQAKKYNINITLIKQVGLTIREYKTKGGIFPKRKGDAIKLHIKKFKLSVEPPERIYFHTNLKGKDCLLLFMKDDLTCVPMRIIHTDGDVELQAIDYKQALWYDLQVKEAQETYKKQGFWEKYGAFVIIGSALIIIVVLFVFTYKYMLDVSDRASMSAQALTEAMNRLGEILKNQQTIQ